MNINHEQTFLREKDEANQSLIALFGFVQFHYGLSEELAESVSGHFLGR